MKKLGGTLMAMFVLALAPAHARADSDGAASGTSQAARMRLEAGRMLSAMEGDAHRVALLLRAARAAKAAPGPLKCIDGFLSQIDAGVRHGREDVADLLASVSTGDLVAARRSLGWLASRREAARWASFAADTCSGAVAAEPDHTEVRIVSPRLPSDRDVFR